MIVLIEKVQEGISRLDETFEDSPKVYAAIVINRDTALMNAGRRKERTKFVNFIENEDIFKEGVG